MYNKQVFSNSDPLKDWKQEMQLKYPNYAFYHHDINSSFDIGAGYDKGQLVTESIVTDGTISIERKNFTKPTIIWANHIITLHNGTCISIEVSNATFMVDIIRKEKEIQYDIHVEENDQDLLKKILKMLCENYIGNFGTSSITFTSPSILLLQSVINGQRNKTKIDLNGKDPKEKYLKRKQKRHS